jgi:glycosyltransferase involved in cell wall biosynthesis
VIVGDGPERVALEREVMRLGLGDVVTLVGRTNQEELLGLYQRATLFVLPCVVVAGGDRDGIPNVLMEAMAVELPVVASAISGIPELIETGHDGLLAPERDVRALAGALERILGDSALRRRLGENGRATVLRKFDAAANAGPLAELFAQSSAR